MSEGPIKRERAATQVPPVARMPKIGDIVIPDAYPAGFPRWRVVELAPHAAPSDVADLEPVDTAASPRRIRRRAGSLQIVDPT